MTKKLLIVEDEEKILKMLLAVFGMEDYEVLYARDGEEALKIVREDFPDLILLDVWLPKINGHEVCKLVKSRPETSEIKILMISGFVQHYDVRKAFEAGADGYMTKPFDTTILLEKIEELLSSPDSNLKEP